MIRKIKILSTLSLLCASLMSFGIAASAVNIMGDVDGDKFITADDARIALKASAEQVALDAAQKFAADIDSDNIVTAEDARSILRVASGLEVFNK